MRYTFILLLLFISFSFAVNESVPLLPMIFYGKIYSNCNIDGAKILAYVNGNLRGEIRVVCKGVSCYYGGDKLADEKLIVEGYRNEVNSVVEFYIEFNGKKIKIGEANFNPGLIVKRDFTISEEICTPSSEEISSTHVGGVSGAGSKVSEKSSEGKTPIKESKEEFPTKKIEDIIKKENIDKLVQKINLKEDEIVKVEIKEVKTKELSIEKEIEVKKIDKIKEIVEKKIVSSVKRNVKVKLKPVEAKVSVKLIEVETKQGKLVKFTKIEKKVYEKNAIEVIPKSVAENAEDVVWVKGKVLKVLERDPIFEVSPENETLSYIVEGNKTNYVDDILTLKLEFVNESVIKNESQPINNVSITNISKKNISGNLTRELTVEKEKFSLLNLTFVIILVLAFIVLFIINYKKLV